MKPDQKAGSKAKDAEELEEVPAPPGEQASSLHGSLEVFTLPDIFRLMALNRVSGALHIDRDSGDGKIFFRDGEVYYAFSSLTREFLGQRLVAAKLISQRKLLQILDDQKREGEGKRLGQLLVEQGVITENDLETFIKEQMQDAIFAMLQWDRGEFSFVTGEEAPQEIGLSVSVENLLMESSRRLEEWEVLARKISSLEMVPVMAPSPPDVMEINIKPEEWSLLVLIDGEKTVSEVAATAGLTDFEACRIIYGLLTAGLLDDAALQGNADNEYLPRAPLREESDLLIRRSKAFDRLPKPGAAPPSPARARKDLADAFGDDAADEGFEEQESSSTGTEAAMDAFSSLGGDDEDERSGEAAPAARPSAPAPERTGAPSEAGKGPAVSKEMLQRLIAGVRNL